MEKRSFYFCLLAAGLGAMESLAELFIGASSWVSLLFTILMVLALLAGGVYTLIVYRKGLVSQRILAGMCLFIFLMLVEAARSVYTYISQ